MPRLEGGPYDGSDLPDDPNKEFIMLTRYNRDECGIHHVYRQVAGRMVYQPEASVAANNA